MRRYFHYRLKEEIPSRKVIVAKVVKVFPICGNFIFITLLKKRQALSPIMRQISVHILVYYFFKTYFIIFHLHKLEYGKTKAMRISRTPSLVQNTIDQKQLQKVEYLNWLGNMITIDARCTWDVKSTIAVVEVAFNKKILFTRKLNLNLWKKLVKCRILRTDFYGAETWTLRKVDKKFWGASSPLRWFNNKEFFVYYTYSRTQLYFIY